MNGRSLLLGIASGVTTFLIVGALVLVGIGDRFGDSPGVGIIAVIIAFVVAIVAVAAITLLADELSRTGAIALVAYATFGVAFLAIAGLSYVNVPGADDVFTFPVHLATSVVFAIAVAVLARNRRPLGPGAAT